MIIERVENLMNERIRIHEPIKAMSVTLKWERGTLWQLQSKGMLRLLRFLDENEITVNTVLHYQNKMCLD